MNLSRASWLMAVMMGVACGGPLSRDMTMGTGGGSGSQGGALQCTQGTDCAYWYCECTGTSTPVNARTCSNGQCASASVACNDGCGAFGRSWTGRTFSSSSTGGTGGGTGGSGGGSNGSGAPGAFCSSRFDCNALTCGCTDGAVLTVRDCYNNTCNYRSSACEDACVDTNHGHWDGR